MSYSFENLRQTKLKKLQEQAENQTKKTSWDNPNEYWTPKLSKDGTASVKLRLLPAPPQDGEDGLPWVMYWRFSFQGVGGYYINKSLDTIGQLDPCQQYNNMLYVSKIPENIAKAKKQNRQLTYESNIEVLQEENCPENEGLVRKFKYGKKIFTKFETAMKGTEDKPAFDPFSFFDGADFRLKIKRVKFKMPSGEEPEFPNYDDSYFLERSPRSNDDEFLEHLWKQEFSLKSVIAPEAFKSYDQLKKEFIKAIGFDPFTNSGEPVKMAAEKEIHKAVVEKTITKPPTISDEINLPWKDSGIDEFDLEFFKNLTK